MYSDEFPLSIYYPEVDTTAEIKDIKAPAQTPFKMSELKPYWPYAAGGLLLLILILVLVRVFRKRPANVQVEEQVPAHVKALASLDKIKEEKIWQKGEVKEYYIQLSDTIRLYIEERYGIPAPESITSEILNEFKRYSYDDELLSDLLESLLQLSDLVKFAKENPDPEENESHLNNAYIFIEKTRVADKLSGLENEQTLNQNGTE